MGKNLSVIAEGAGLYFAGFGISKVLALVFIVMVSRSLQPEVFGIYSVGVIITGIVILFGALGLHNGILHFVAVYDSTGKKERVRGTILFGMKTQLVSSTVLAVAFFLLSDFIAINFFREPQLAIVFKALALVIPFGVLTSALMNITLAFKKIKYKIFVRNIAENIAKIAFTGLLFLLGFQLFGAALGLALSSLFAFFVSLYVVQKKVFPIFARGAKAKYNPRELFAYSWPLLAVGFFSILMGSIDSIMLGGLSKMYDVGLYNVASPIANILVVASFAFGSLFLPIITGLYAQKKLDEFNKTFKVVTRWTFSAIFPCLLFTLLFASEIITVIFGSIYAAAAGALGILAVGIFMVSFVGPVRQILESIGRTKLILVNTVIAGIINIVLNLWLIPLFASTGAAIIGAAIATSFSYFLWNALALGEVFVLTKMHPYSKAYKSPTVAAAVAIALFYFLKQLLPEINALFFPVDMLLLALLGIGFLGIYSLFFVVLKGLQPEDLDILRAFENKFGFKVEFARNFVKRFR